MAGKKILILTNRVPYPLNDGGNIAMNAMIEGYHKRGWQVFLLAMNTTRHYITQTQLQQIYRDIAGFETVDVNNDVKPIPTLLNFLFSKEPNHAVRFYKAAFAKKLEDVISRFKPDAVQVESIFLSGYLPLIKRISEAKTILRLHNIEYQVWQRYAAETKNTWKKIYLANLATRIRRYEERAWEQYDLLVPITSTDEQIVKQSCAICKAETIPFGIKRKHYPAAEDAAWSAYHLGAMDWMPNAEAISWFLKEVWPAIHEELPHLKFYFAGRKMPLHFMQMDIPAAHCLGEVPDADAFIADKKILIVPLRSAAGIRVKILEAMAAGKVVVSTETGMQGIYAEDGVHYLRANNAGEFVEALKRIFSDKAAAEKIALNAKALVEDRYDESLLIERLAGRVAAMIG